MTHNEQTEIHEIPEREKEVEKELSLEDRVLDMIKREIALLKETKGIIDDDFDSPCEKRMTRKEKSHVIYYTKAMYIIFTFIWILLCIANKLYDNIAAYVLLIPFVIFMFGYFNAECTCNTEVESDVFGVSFVSIGILVSIPLLTLFNKDDGNKKASDKQDDNSKNDNSVPEIKNEDEMKKQEEKEKSSKRLNHIIFLAMISVLLIYLPIWVGYHDRHIYKAARSCLETFSITLYIYAIMIFFVAL